MNLSPCFPISRPAAALALLGALACGSAGAITPATVDGAALRESARSEAPPARSSRTATGAATSTPSAAATPSLELVRARLDAVDLVKRELTLGGRVLGLHPTALRVVSPGGQRLSGADALRPGMRLRFAREPASAGAGAALVEDTGRRIVLIYIEPGT